MRRVATVGRRGCAGQRGERGQALIFLVGVFTVVLVIAAIVVDVGLWLAERAAVQRAADFAALAGAQELPADDAAALVDASAWAQKNGYVDGVDGVQVTTELLCKNNLPFPPAGLCADTNPSGPSPCQPGDGCDSLRVVIHKPSHRLFSALFGVGEVHVASGAAAGLDVNVTAVDAVMLVDVTFSMARGCNATQDSAGCPIKEARDAASSLVDILLGSGGPRQAGFAPYRGCYNPPRLYENCVAASSVISLTGDASVLHAGIDQATAVGGTGTNMCLALRKAQEVLTGPGAQQGGDTRRFIVFLADGDNIYNVNSYGEGQPPPECSPSDPATSDDYIGTECFPRQTRERELDVKTYAMANTLKAQGVSVYVVGLGVCGTDDGHTAADAGYCAGIGDGAHDDIAGQRLLKCIVSSPSQYHPVSSAQELPDIFQLIAWEIAGRGLLQ